MPYDGQNIQNPHVTSRDLSIKRVNRSAEQMQRSTYYCKSCISEDRLFCHSAHSESKMYFSYSTVFKNV